MKLIKTVLILAVLTALAATAWADVPRLINFQGRLSKDTLGTPVKDSTYSILFTIYDDPSAGTNLWSETQPVATKGGTFNVNLGSATALPDTIFDDTSRYLAMKVGTDDEMTPRQRMVSMAYGYRVRTVDGATGGTITGDVNIASNLTVSGKVSAESTSISGDLTVSGNIIGSTPWTAFPFAAGYNDQEDGHPAGGYWQRFQYLKIGDIVYLRGSAHRANHAAIPYLALFGTLPVGFRPPATIRFYSIQVQSDGLVYSLGTSGEQQWVDGICFSTSP